MADRVDWVRKSEAGYQFGDRPALWFYERLTRSFFSPGYVLDFGCGQGFLAKRLARHFRVDGYDVSPGARQSMQWLVPGARVFQDMSSVPRAVYSGIVAVHVIEHLTDGDIRSVLQGWRDALLPGGRVLCVTPDLSGKGHALKGSSWVGFGDPFHINLKARDDWRRLFEEFGFRVLKVGTDGLWDLPYISRLPKWMDAGIHSVGTVVQFLVGRLILPEGSGESAIFLLEKP